MRRSRAAHPHVVRSAFAGFRFPPGVITVAVRWYLRYGLSYRDVEELLAERGIEVANIFDTAQRLYRPELLRRSRTVVRNAKA